jgi:N-formylglutamate amidohydrolase
MSEVRLRRPYSIHEGDGPIVATAIHAGHDVRDDVAVLMALDERTRRREEDPFTDGWTSIAPNRVLVHRSRFEVDLNRPPEDAVCFVPEDCWDLQVWRDEIPAAVVDESLRIYQRFYDDLHSLLEGVIDRCGHFVLFDLHSYNHRRLECPADPEGNPEVNVGTGSVDRNRWGHVIDHFIEGMRSEGLDARENVRFRGGHMAGWTNRLFAEHGCALAIDVKKFFMDERTGELDREVWQRVRDALAATLPHVLDLTGAR